MVHGTAKHVVVVKNPGHGMFEQAIFIVKREEFQRGGRSEEEVLKAARMAADGYLRGLFQKSEKCDIISVNHRRWNADEKPFGF